MSCVGSSTTQAQAGSIEVYLQHPLLGDIIKKCSDKLLWQKNLEQEQLSAAIDTVVKTNKGERGSVNVLNEGTSVSSNAHPHHEERVHANMEPVRGGKSKNC